MTARENETPLPLAVLRAYVEAHPELWITEILKHETEIIEISPGRYFGICTCEYVTVTSDDWNWIDAELSCHEWETQ